MNHSHDNRPSREQRPNNPSAGAELAWLAFCYVVDELDAVQREAFEAQLAVDQAAREAVALAVEWTVAARVHQNADVLLAAAIPAAACLSPITAGRAAVVEPASRFQTIWQSVQAKALRPAAWMASGAAACFLALTVLGDRPQAQDSSETPLASTTTTTTTAAPANVEPPAIRDPQLALASAWVGLNRPAAGDLRTTGFSADGVDSAWRGEGSTSIDESAPAQMDDPLVPSWLLKALSEHPWEEPCHEGD